jgi:hypothetical protein
MWKASFNEWGHVIAYCQVNDPSTGITTVVTSEMITAGTTAALAFLLPSKDQIRCQ